MALLIEVSPAVTATTRNTGEAVEKVSLQTAATRVVDVAEELFRTSLKTAIVTAATAFQEAIEALEKPPASAEFSFGMKFSGELGNFILTKIAAESTCAVKLTWTR